jgi:hypothetical protein
MSNLAKITAGGRLRLADFLGTAFLQAGKLSSLKFLTLTA